MRHSKRWHSLRTLLTLTVLVTLCSAAQAEDPKIDEETRDLRSRDILLSDLDEPTAQQSWLRSHFHFAKKRGVEYRQSIQVGEQKLLLKAWGPVIKKRPGLGVEVRGITIANHDLVLRLYGNTRKQGLRLKLTF